jgi:hypothetical protein
MCGNKYISNHVSQSNEAFHDSTKRIPLYGIIRQMPLKNLIINNATHIPNITEYHPWKYLEYIRMYNNVSAWMLLHQNNYDYTVMFPNLRVLIIKYNIDTYAIIDKFIKTLPKSLSYLELIASSIYDMVESLKLSDEILPNLTHLITGTNVELTNMNSLKSVNCDNYTFINTCDNLL